jgi:hypothetical protein
LGPFVDFNVESIDEKIPIRSVPLAPLPAAPAAGAVKSAHIILRLAADVSLANMACLALSIDATCQ